jgi:hypothetical protein
MLCIHPALCVRFNEPNAFRANSIDPIQHFATLRFSPRTISGTRALSHPKSAGKKNQAIDQGLEGMP